MVNYAFSSFLHTRKGMGWTFKARKSMRWTFKARKDMAWTFKARKGIVKQF